MTKSWNPTLPIIKSRRPTPEEVKMRVLRSQRLNRFIDENSENNEDRNKKVYEVVQMLSEIAFDKKLLVIRSLGTVITKVMNQIYSAVLINEKSLENVRQSLGHQQVLYLPSHRSYADFILMSYICFSYNMEIPAIAAGMDFHGMMGLGELLRKTGAFFMRRTFSNNSFYWNVFKEYMHEVVTHNDSGLEFFVEGTRSRSCKALTPKTGLLSMALEPYFMGELHNIMIVPISVSYEKPLEEQLFVYELLGIPKPKESTMGFFKAVTSMKDQNYGKIYFDFDEPMTLNEYFGTKVDRFVHASEPAHVQTLRSDELQLITDLANEVVRRQQNKIVIMTYNLIALIYNEMTFTNTIDELQFWELKRKIIGLTELFETFGALVAVDLKNLDKDIHDTFAVHGNILELVGNNNNVHLIKSNVDLKNMNISQLKGHRLCNEVMNIAVPALSLQLYCNPAMFWLAEPAFFVLSALGRNSAIRVDDLKADVDLLRQTFIYEFVLYPAFAEQDFNKTLHHLEMLEIFDRTTEGFLNLNCDSKFINLLLSAISPFLISYFQTARTILNDLKEKKFVDKDVFETVQRNSERELLKGNPRIHPYSLCLDSINLAIISLCNSGCLFKEKE